MAKNRKGIPRQVQDAVLKEFNHRCAIRGEDHPQLHHIDENPENNDPMNLLPLCPNCHLTDQHNPTAKIPIGILRLFRKYKDPTILKAQFQPLFARMSWFYFPELQMGVMSSDVLRFLTHDLCRFIRCLNMGAYYCRRMQVILPVDSLKDTPREAPSRIEDAEKLIIEMLRYQEWPQAKSEHGRP